MIKNMAGPIAGLGLIICGLQMDVGRALFGLVLAYTGIVVMLFTPHDG